MRLLLGLFSVVLATAGACACSREVNSTSSRVTARQPAVADLEYFVAWGDSPEFGLRSYWLEYASGKLKVRGEFSGAAFLARGGVYRFRRTAGVAHAVKTCPEAGTESEPPGADNLVDQEVMGAVAERLDAVGTLTIEPLPEPQNALMFSNRVELRGSLGTYLFLDSSSDARYCSSAHDSQSTSTATFDLLRGRDVEFPTAADRAMLRSWVLSNRRASLRDCLRGRWDAFGQPFADDVHEEFQVQAVVPTWSKQGQFGFDLELTAYRSHAEGLLSCQVSSDQAPPSLVGLRVPLGLRALAQQLPGLALRGFSVLEAKGTAAAVERVFAEQARREREP
jgi:hypothetical protein